MNILCAEDDPITRKIYRTYLSRHFIDCFLDEAEHGKNALEIFIDNPEKYDLILTDVSMPTMDGIEFATEVRRLNKNVRIVFFSSYPKYLTDTSQIEGAEFVNKPITLSKLKAIIANDVDSIKLS